MSEFAVIVILLTSGSTYSEWCVHYDAGEVEIKVIYLRGHESVLEIVNASVYCQLGRELSTWQASYWCTASKCVGQLFSIGPLPFDQIAHI